MDKKIEFKDLSWGLKIPIVYGWFGFVMCIISFMFTAFMIFLAILANVL